MALLFGRHCSMQCKKKVERGSSEVFVTTLSQRAIAGKRRICVLCANLHNLSSNIEFHRPLKSDLTLPALPALLRNFRVGFLDFTFSGTGSLSSPSGP